MKIANALVIAGIEILDRWDSVLISRRTERVENFPAETGIFHAPFAAGGMVLGFEKVVDMLAKIGPNVVP